MRIGGYQEALEWVNVRVYAWENFGDYQGSWLARVVMPDGRSGWITGSYGSCSGCDAFESEFDRYTDLNEADYDRKVRDFAEGYTSDFQTTDQIRASYERQEEDWHDQETQQILDFIDEWASDVKLVVSAL